MFNIGKVQLGYLRHLPPVKGVQAGFGASAAIDSAGGNIESAGNSCQFDQASDQASVAVADLALGALAANGGWTRTIALGGTSVALGAALDALCAGEDQRGVARESDCESGLSAGPV